MKISLYLFILLIMNISAHEGTENHKHSDENLFPKTRFNVNEAKKVIMSEFKGRKKNLISNGDTINEIESYRINTQKLIEIKVEKDKKHISVTNWVPVNIKNVLIVAKAEDGEIIPCLFIDFLPGLQKIFLNDIEEQFLSDKLIFDFLPQNNLQENIKSIKVSWNLSFKDGFMNNPKPRKGNVLWRPLRPPTVRYLLAFVINAAQTVSHDKFKEIWIKTPFQNYINATSGKGSPVKKEYALTKEEYEKFPQKEKDMYKKQYLDFGLYYSKEHRQMVLDRYYNKRLSLGVTGGGGLGGGATVGINHNKFIPRLWFYSVAALKALEEGKLYLDKNKDKTAFRTPWDIWGHECGHALGFGHTSNYCVKAGYSHITVGTLVYSSLVKNKELIVLPENMVQRDIQWEGKYNIVKPNSERTRPTIEAPYEWGGKYARHEFLLPRKPSEEWNEYIAAHKTGKGYEYIKLMPMNILIEKHWRQWDRVDRGMFMKAYHNDQGLEYMKKYDKGEEFILKEISVDNKKEGGDDGKKRVNLTTRNAKETGVIKIMGVLKKRDINKNLTKKEKKKLKKDKYNKQFRLLSKEGRYIDLTIYRDTLSDVDMKSFLNKKIFLSGTGLKYESDVTFVSGLKVKEVSSNEKSR